MVLKGVLWIVPYLMPTPGCSDSESGSEQILSFAKALLQIKIE